MYIYIPVIDIYMFACCFEGRNYGVVHEGPPFKEAPAGVSMPRVMPTIAPGRRNANLNSRKKMLTNPAPGTKHKHDIKPLRQLRTR
jgi:hypothetical protein